MGCRGDVARPATGLIDQQHKQALRKRMSDLVGCRGTVAFTSNIREDGNNESSPPPEHFLKDCTKGTY